MVAGTAALVAWCVLRAAVVAATKSRPGHPRNALHGPNGLSALSGSSITGNNGHQRGYPEALRGKQPGEFSYQHHAFDTRYSKGKTILIWDQ